MSVRSTNPSTFISAKAKAFGQAKVRVPAGLRVGGEQGLDALVVNGFVRDVLQQLPMEFMAETQKLIGISLEGSVG